MRTTWRALSVNRSNNEDLFLVEQTRDTRIRTAGRLDPLSGGGHLSLNSTGRVCPAPGAVRALRATFHARLVALRPVCRHSGGSSTSAWPVRGGLLVASSRP